MGLFCSKGVFEEKGVIFTLNDYELVCFKALVCNKPSISLSSYLQSFSLTDCVEGLYALLLLDSFVKSGML
jgi:hypothetical protein